MRAAVRLTIVAILAAVLLPAGANAAPVQYADVPPGSAHPALITYRDARMQRLVHELELASPTAARMMAAIRAYGVPVLFGTAASVLRDVRAEHHDYDPFRQKALGFMAPTVRPLPGGDGFGTFAMVVGLDLERVEEIFEIARSLPRPATYTWQEIERLETLALLGHEIVHAYGLVLADGDPRRGCLDPVEGQPPGMSCVVVGENLIRSEIGAPLDWGYGLAPLIELPARYEAHGERRLALRSIAERATALLREHVSSDRSGA